jgi:hypothetical protein
MHNSSRLFRGPRVAGFVLTIIVFLTKVHDQCDVIQVRFTTSTISQQFL